MSILHSLVERAAISRAYQLVEPTAEWFKQEQGVILDVGCGLGHVGLLAGRLSGREVLSLDVRRYPFSAKDMRLVLAEGKAFPFKANSVDTVMIFFVLHHVPYPNMLLIESYRVARKDLIICEDLVTDEIDKKAERIKDFVANFCQPNLFMAHRFENEWESLFGNSGLLVEDKLYFSSKSTFGFKFRHVCWHLRLV